MNFSLPKKIPPIPLKLIVSVMLVSTFLFVGSAPSAHAECGTFFTPVSECVLQGIASVANFILSAFTKGVDIAANTLYYVINMKVTDNVPVVQESWKIIRDFCNMFFILVMIIMAFGTIFDVAGYGSSKELITKFIIAAILINFSLVIGGLVIDGVNVINNVFLTSLGNFSNRIGQAIAIGPTLLGTGGGVAANASGIVGIDLLLRIVFSSFLAVIILFSLVTAIFFSLMRIPFIWILLILSPLAWLSNILPATRNLWKKWWDEFIAWNTFLPIFLFFLYFGFFFLSRQAEVMANLSTSFSQGALTSQDTLKMGAGFTIQAIFFYFMTAFILIFGTGMAIAASRSGMAGKVVALSDKWSMAIRNNLPVVGQVTAVGEGISQGLKYQVGKVQQEGFPGRAGWLYGGQQNLDRIRARAAQGFGAPGTVEEQRRIKVKYFEDKFKKENLGIERLRSNLASADGEEKLAIYKRLKDFKDLSGSESLEAYKLYQSKVGRNSAADFAKDIDFKKDFEKNERLDWFKDKDVGEEIKRKLANVMAEEGELRKDDSTGIDHLKQAASLFKSTNDQRDFLLTKAASKNLVHAYRIAEELGIKDAKGIEVKVTSGNYLENAISRLKPEKLIGLIDGGWYDAQKDDIKSDDELIDPDKKLLKNKILDVMKNNPTLAGSLMKDATAEQRLVIKSLAKNAMAKGAAEVAAKAGASASSQYPDPSAGSDGTPPPSASGASINQNNVIDLRDKSNINEA